MALLAFTQRAPEDEQAHDEQIAKDIWPNELAGYLGEEKRTDNAAGVSGNGKEPEQATVDIAMQEMRGAGSRGGEELGGMDGGRCMGGRHAARQQEDRGNDAIAHAPST